MRSQQANGTRSGRRGDLLAGPFPLGDWGQPAERLGELYAWVEAEAQRTVRWYLADRVRKRRAARALRLGAALGVAGGAAMPLLELAGAGGWPCHWGYLALLLAAVCLGCDRYFGVTSGWMRDVATAQAVQRRLETLRYDWAAESVREALGPPGGTTSEAAERCLGVLRRFSEDVTELVRAETADWMREFHSGGAATPLARGDATAEREPPADDGAAAADPPRGGRVPAPPIRPSMPRQRPPEPPARGL